MSKRKRPDSRSAMGGLNEDEKKIYELIRSKEDKGATVFELKAETNIIHALITRSLTILKKNNLIKEIPKMDNKGYKHFLAMEFEPCKELTGGEWYKDGTLNVEKIEGIKGTCVAILETQKQSNQIVTFEKLCSYFQKVPEDKLTREQVKEILKNLILDNVIIEVKSNGLGEVYYKLAGTNSDNGEGRVGTFASVPCGGCPHIGLCSPDGVISPATCNYFQKWLDF